MWLLGGETVTCRYSTHPQVCPLVELLVMCMATAAQCLQISHTAFNSRQQQCPPIDCFIGIAHLAERLRAARAGSVRACYIMADGADELLWELQFILHVAVLMMVAPTAGHFSWVLPSDRCMQPQLKTSTLMC